MSNVLDIADDSLNTSGKLSIKVSKQIPIEEWNKVSDPGQSITWTVPGGEHLKLKLRFYPKGDAIGEEKVSVWFGGLTKHPDTHVNVALTLGFESPVCPEPCSITQEMAPVNLNARPDCRLTAGYNFMKIGKVPEYIVNDCLVFHAEIVVSFTGDPQSLTLSRYFDEDAEKEDVRHGLLQKIKATAHFRSFLLSWVLLTLRPSPIYRDPCSNSPVFQQLFLHPLGLRGSGWRNKYDLASNQILFFVDLLTNTAFCLQFSKY